MEREKEQKQKEVQDNPFKVNPFLQPIDKDANPQSMLEKLMASGNNLFKTPTEAKNQVSQPKNPYQSQASD